MPAFSTRNSTLPAFASRTALPTSNVTVPTLGFGMARIHAELRSELHRLVELRRPVAGRDGANRFLEGIAARPLDLGRRSTIPLASLRHVLHDLEAEAPGRTLDRPHGGRDVGRR